MAASATPAKHAALMKRGQLEDLVGGEVDIRLMPLGASITFGLTSSDGNGYRAHLRDHIVSDGGVDTSHVDMVGSIQAGDMADNDVEGYSGLRIDEVRTKAGVAVPKYSPNVVTINLGTNDANQTYDVPGAKERMRDLVDFLLDNMAPGGPVVLSTLLVNSNTNTEGRVKTINAGYRELVAEYQSAGSPVVLAEMHDTEGLGTDQLVDGTHPTDAGYARMAEIWWDALLDAAERGYFAGSQSASSGGDEDGDNDDDVPTSTRAAPAPATTAAASGDGETATPTPDPTLEPTQDDKDSHGSRINNPMTTLLRTVRCGSQR
jgi:lysophospholipase L1-like esterase